jgi:calcium-dependent protein kinase
MRAIKKIKKKNLDQVNQKQLLSEFEALKKLDHPNIVKLIEHYEDKDHIFLVQEYLSGLQLFEELCEREQFSEEEAREIFKKALQAINYIHSMNVSHRDIKPENFVFENVASNNIKLIDFGLSSSFISVSEAKNKPFLLRMRTPVGTMNYAAPEVY